jgi:hypothetical protein
VKDRCIADTSVFIASETGRTLDLRDAPAEVGISVITIGELRSGVLAATDAATADRRLETLTRVLAFEALPIDLKVASCWARLRVELREAGRRMPLNDSWIAATAIAWQVPVISQDDDFEDVPGLELIRV